MKPYGTIPKKKRHQTRVKGHPINCGGCHRNWPILVKSKKAARRAARLETSAIDG